MSFLTRKRGFDVCDIVLILGDGAVSSNIVRRKNPCRQTSNDSHLLVSSDLDYDLLL